MVEREEQLGSGGASTIGVAVLGSEVAAGGEAKAVAIGFGVDRGVQGSQETTTTNRSRETAPHLKPASKD